MRGSVKVTIPAALDRLPQELARRTPLFLRRAADEMAAEIGARAPGGRAGAVGASFQGELASPTESIVVSHHPGARALDRGAYITAKHAGANGRPGVIRFHGRTGDVFRRAVRIRGRNYTRRAIAAKKRSIVTRAFQRTFTGLP